MNATDCIGGVFSCRRGARGWRRARFLRIYARPPPRGHPRGRDGHVGLRRGARAHEPPQAQPARGHHPREPRALAQRAPRPRALARAHAAAALRAVAKPARAGRRHVALRQHVVHENVPPCALQRPRVHLCAPPLRAALHVLLGASGVPQRALLPLPPRVTRRPHGPPRKADSSCSGTSSSSSLAVSAAGAAGAAGAPIAMTLTTFLQRWPPLRVSAARSARVRRPAWS